MKTFGFIATEKAGFPTTQLCRVLGVSKSGYYAWRRRLPSRRATADAHLSTTIGQIHTQSRGTYGVPCVHAELADLHGVACSRKRIARLMRAARLVGVCRRRRAHTTVREATADPSDDLVQRAFTATAPDQLWVADITYLPTWQGFLYLAVVLDVASRGVVGWAMADHLRTELVLDALDMALWNRKPAAGLIHHSDHGCQYTSLAFSRRCREAGIAQSMGSVGDCFDCDDPGALLRAA